MVLQDFHCTVEKYYRVTSKNCTTQALNSDVYPISHIPETSNPIEDRHSAAKWGWKKNGVGAGGRGSYYYFYCLFKIFNWRTIDLQCCADFCHTTTSISRMYPCVPFLWPSLTDPTPLGHHRAVGWAPCVIEQLPTILHIVSYTWEKEMAPHSSALAWETPWTKEPGGLQSTGSHRVGHDWATKQVYTRQCHTLSSPRPLPHTVQRLGHFCLVSKKRGKWTIHYSNFHFCFYT